MPLRKVWALVAQLGDETDQAPASTAEARAGTTGPSREYRDAQHHGVEDWQVALIEEFVAVDLVAESGVYDETRFPPERFLVLLILYHGGRCWQGQLVSTVEWSSATVSRHLSEPESDGAIERVKVGREKLIFTPDHRPHSLGNDEEN